ncbi:hypothetical protein GCM10011352_29720 [Marinobacterium zhoushanense]|uniref:YjiS-like domain-containing protein n=1 Tax=Marinobacterium zhoushanense TaxID=1679163 RepID=A0ABQ1KIS8_9GAMM|nr:DUF1127 domain-containing protein [Marinobacterium zhoushanense]GGC01615.1 hypothetical protein GCM10011352_29720 [Marinobacterium zhoushanense]
MNSSVKTVAPADAVQSQTVGFNTRLKRLLKRIGEWRQRHRQRDQLMALSPWMLKDIGISRADAVHEGSKPFWRE